MNKITYIIIHVLINVINKYVLNVIKNNIIWISFKNVYIIVKIKFD